MMTTITDTQARALAALVAALRSDWDVPGIRKALWDARTKGSAAQLAHAAIEAAVGTDARTPAVIALDGPHWSAVRPMEAAPVKVERCTEPGHSSYPAWSCGACRAEQIGADEPVPVEPLADPEEYARGAAVARAALAGHERHALTADHKAGEHTTPVPDCPRCTSPEPVEDAKTRAAGERPWSPTDAARTA